MIPLHCFRSEVAFGYAESSFSAPAVQRSSPNPNPHNTWYMNLRLVISKQSSHQPIRLRSTGNRAYRNNCG